MKKYLSLTVVALCLAGCTSTNLTRVISELKQDPATVEFSVVAPGYAITFKRAWPTNIVRVPSSMLQVNPNLPPVPLIPFNDPLR